MSANTQHTTFSLPPRPWAVVLAGGSGQRLAPLTRALYGRPLPKQFCRLGCGTSLLQDTVERLRPTVPAHRTVVVVEASRTRLARRQLGGGVTVIGQPRDRGTASGVLLPLMHVLMRDPEATVVVTPSDHGIADRDLFRRGLEDAVAAVRTNPARIVLFGVEAGAPRTDYGWILPEGDGVPAVNGARFRPVARFVEKPPPAEARRLHDSGALWNTFVMVGKGVSFVNLYRRRLPETARFFEKYARLDESRRDGWLRERYDRLEPANFSHDILESAADLAVYTWPAALAWTDLGTPERLFEWLETEGRLATVMATLKRRGATELIREAVPPALAAAAP
ncbi:MAG: NTP transferase domain-containing protein [Planctomycetes bacterium]|nr:NTP transferase domain-containing protein [Planctomycetota bacterium]